MDKKAAEDQARLAKEATGRAMFEKGDWDVSGGEDSEDDGEDDDETWNMEKLRQETEALREKKEAERIAGYGNGAPTNGDTGGSGHFEPDINGADEGVEASWNFNWFTAAGTSLNLASWGSCTYHDSFKALEGKYTRMIVCMLEATYLVWKHLPTRESHRFSILSGYQGALRPQR